MTETQRLEIGFAGGQVVSLRLQGGPIAGLRKALEQHEGWHDLETQDGTIALDLSKIVFVRIADSPQTIGFSGD
jgi:hypothetical protein